MAGFDLSLLLPLPLPLVFHSAWNFFDGASRTLPAHAGHGAVAVAVAPAGCTPWAGPLTGGIELLSTIGTPTTSGSNGFCRACLAGSVLVAAGGSALFGSDL